VLSRGRRVTSRPSSSIASPARHALAEGWPVFITSLLVGIPFGVLAREAGLDLAQTSGMSVIVFAGAAQFAAIELLRAGAPAALVVVTVLFLNLRHVLMGLSLRPFLAGVSRPRRAALAYLLVDESFAMAIGWFRRGGRGVAYYAAFAAGMWVSWNLGTLVGAVAGGVLGDPRRLGIDFAITAVFVSIVVLGTRGRADLAVAIVAVLVAGALRLLGAGAVAVLAAGLVAPLIVFAFREPS
jgi:4-azaleucine resistance transporter AzlC